MARKLLILTLVLGTASLATATPSILGSDTIHLDETGTYSFVGTEADSGGFSGFIWVDYPSYTGMLSNVSIPEDPGIFWYTDPTYLPYAFFFSIAADPTIYDEIPPGVWFTFDFTPPPGAAVGNTYGLDLLGPAWDYISTFPVTVIADPVDVDLDFGDAPDSYGTLLESNGARHIIDDVTFMGESVDAEPNGLPDAAALGDDNDNTDDEDGVNQTTEVTVSVDGYLNAWFDFNVNGRFTDIYEHPIADLPLVAGQNIVSYTPPIWSAIDLMSYCRYRFTSYDPNGGLGYDGEAADGEVEDYQFFVSTDLPCFSEGDPDYDMWVSVGKPFCWCCEYQCLGDADCDFEGKDQDGKRKWVTLPDLQTFGDCWQKVDDQDFPPYCICADFDHDFEGKDIEGHRKRVSLPDLAIFGAGWMKVDTDPHFTQNPCFP